MKFEWSERKNQLNLKKHGVSFESALYVFHDPYVLSAQDERFNYNEERWQSIGLVNNVALYVAYTVKGESGYEEEIIRIISARVATARETYRYYASRQSQKRNRKS